LRHGLGIAKVRTGCCSALANETPSGACAAHSFGLGKAGLKRRDTFTILALQLLFPMSSESMGDHDSGPDDWWRVS